MPANPSEILLYQSENGETRIQVRLVDETVWLTQAQMAELFDKDVRTIKEHVGNIFDEQECEETATVRNFRIIRDDGKRQVSCNIAHYNLDVIISVPERHAIQLFETFRQEQVLSYLREVHKIS